MNYFKLYIAYLKRSFISRLEYRKDWYIAMFSFFVANAASIASIYMIVNSIPSLQGWSIFELGFLYGFSMLPIALDHMFADDLWLIAYRKVQNGELDKYFLRPIPVLFQVIAEVFQPEGFGELLVGITMLVLCGLNVSINWSFPLVLLLVVAVIFGAMIITSLKIMMAALAFPFKRSGVLLQIVYNFNTYAKYPLTIFPMFIKCFLTFVVPFGLIISVPIETVFFNTYNPLWLCLIIIGVAIVFVFLAIFIWTKLERKYQSTGS